MDETTGEIDPEKLKRNLNLAIDAYINRMSLQYNYYTIVQR